MPITESDVEDAAIGWFEGLGYEFLHGPDIAPGEPKEERTSYQEVALRGRVRMALERLNPPLPDDALDSALSKILTPASPSLIQNNRAFHAMLRDGVPIEYRGADGRVKGDIARLMDPDDPDNNEWLVVNQFTVKEGNRDRRPDIVVFLNGLPVAVFELKNAADEEATIWTAFKQLQTYKAQIPSLFTYNEVLVVSDGLEARVGSLSADSERFMPWRALDDERTAPSAMPQLEVVIEGLFHRRRFLSYLRDFIVFEDDGVNVVKKLAGYHQFHAVQRAVEATVKASGMKGDRRCGVVWHTQGSGKSLTMLFYAGRIIRHSFMGNPTLVVLTDRNDLDDQLFSTFASCSEVLRQKPVQAADRAHLRELLKVASGGVVFTTIQKFVPDAKGDAYPELSDRRNLVVIADEAHRSQYGFIEGFARHLRDALPHASFIGFTGTPIEKADRSTPAVFGEYVSVYDVQRAVEDGATVPIYYEGRLAKLALSQKERPRIDPEFEEVTEGEESARRERLKTKWAQLEAIVGTEKRIALVATDIVEHFEQRVEALEGKAMVVCMSRRICVELHDAIVQLRPEWDSGDDSRGAIKVVMTGAASDKAEWQKHIRNKAGREAIARRFKDSKDPLKVVLVRDMWLTGFDVPCLHTMYLDKPMRGHTLMQAIARVNRVFSDKPGGLVVDYLGIADQLKLALSDYTDGGGTGRTAIDQAEAVALLKEKLEICRDLFRRFDYGRFATGTPAERLALLPRAQEHILAQDDGKERLLDAVAALSKAFALSVPHKDALKARDDVEFFQAVRAVLAKRAASETRPEEELDFAVRQIVSRAVAPSGIVDIFSAAGLKKPDLSILSEEFLAEVRGLPHRNLAVELLQKLLNDEIKNRSRKNVVQARSFAEMLEQAVRKYHNRAVETVRVIDELIGLAREMREAQARGEKLGLSDDELAFYDALEVNDSAVKVLGDETLRTIARELVLKVRSSVTIDWTVKESVRAEIRLKVKGILRIHGYPPDKQERAIQTVLQQAELLAAGWAETPT